MWAGENKKKKTIQIYGNENETKKKKVAWKLSRIVFDFNWLQLQPEYYDKNKN